MSQPTAQANRPVARIAVVLGTRPEVIKLAPVISALRCTDWIAPVVMRTGQHSDLFVQTMNDVGLTVDLELAFQSSQPVLAEAGSMLTQITKALMNVGADAVLVQGDTTSALCGALAGFHVQVPVVHLEAGLRSYDLAAPFPEEGNRRAISALASLHLCPSTKAAANLQREGVEPRRIAVTGNTVVDVAVKQFQDSKVLTDPVLRALADSVKPLVIVAMHRRESWGLPLIRVRDALDRLAQARPNITFIVILHPNPEVSVPFSALAGRSNVVITNPLPHSQFLKLLSRSRAVVTDSGGIQEEAPSFGVPVLVLRDKTERIEGVELGLSEMLAVGVTELWRHLDDFIHKTAAGKPVAYAGWENPYGDGNATERCVESIARLLDRRDAYCRPSSAM